MRHLVRNLLLKKKGLLNKKTRKGEGMYVSFENNDPRSASAVPSLPLNEDGITITPYRRIGDDYAFSDRHLAGIYRRMVKEKTLHKTFFDRKIKNTNDFIDYLKDSNLNVFFVSYRGQESGFFWLKEFFPRASFITYCLYKSFWGKHTFKISQACIDAIFNAKDEHGNSETDILLGLTPSTNKLALKLLAQNGMKIVGNIPDLIWDEQKGRLVGGVLSYRHRRNGSVNNTILSLFSLK